MTGYRFLRLKRFLRWFLNTSPDWYESRSQVNEPVKIRQTGLGAPKIRKSISRDSPELENGSEKSRKDW